MANRLCCLSSQACIPYNQCTQWMFTEYGSKQPSSATLYGVDYLQYNNFYNFNIQSSINEIKVTSKLKLDYNISAETKLNNTFAGAVAAKRNAVYDLLTETYQSPFYWQTSPDFSSYNNNYYFYNGQQITLNGVSQKLETSIRTDYLMAHHSRSYYYYDAGNGFFKDIRLYTSPFGTISNRQTFSEGEQPEARIFKSFQLKKGIYKFSLVNMHVQNINMGALCRSRIPYLLCKNSNSRFYGFYREGALSVFNSLRRIIDGPSYNLDYNGGLPTYYNSYYNYFKKILYPLNITAFIAQNLRESQGYFSDDFQPQISFPPNGDYILDVPGNTQVTFTLIPVPKYDLKQEDLSKSQFSEYSEWGFPRKISSKNSKGKETISFFGLYGDNICNDETKNSITLATPIRAFNEATFTRDTNFICGNNINI